MNSKEELQEKYGLSEQNALKMITGYKGKIGEKNGDYIITDITYIGNGTKIVEETCYHCGAVITREMVNSRNKWSELQRFCPNEEKERRKEKRSIREKEEENKRNERIKAKQNAMAAEIGKEYGEYKIIGTDGVSNLIAKCSVCGSEKSMNYDCISTGMRKDFICHTHRRNLERFTEDFVGKKNNMLEIKGITHEAKSGRKRFICQCDCGKICYVKPTYWENGNVVSCGCYQENRSINADPTKRIKAIYRGMKRRCYNSDAKEYKIYGARGITICEEWLNDFDAFLRWSLENGYENTRTIDRIDSNGDYCPENCRWATYYVQNRNHRPRKKQCEYEERL